MQELFRLLSVCVLMVLLLSGLGPLGTHGHAQEEEGQEAVVEPPPPLYENQLLRLAEILGSLHFLHLLCEDDDAPAWRVEMEALLANEQLGEKRKAQYIGRFNHGFETYNAVYRSCTPSARRAINLYLVEGAQIASDVKVRYGQ